MVQKRTRNGQPQTLMLCWRLAKRKEQLAIWMPKCKGDVVKAGEVVKSNEDRVREYYETVEEVAQEQVSLKGKMSDLTGER